MLCLMLQVYLNHGDSWDTASKEGLHSLLPAVWSWFCAIQAVLSDKVDQSWLELLYRINGTCRGRGRECGGEREGVWRGREGVWRGRGKECGGRGGSMEREM